MKAAFLFLVFAAGTVASADSLPVISTQPHNLSGSGSFSVVSSNATGFQWRWNRNRHSRSDQRKPVAEQLDPTGYSWWWCQKCDRLGAEQLAYPSRVTGGVVPYSDYGNTGFDA